MTGRNPKPNGAKARSGRALVWFEALSPTEGTPPPPKHLDQNAVFARITACRSLTPQRLVSHIDMLALEMVAEAFSRWRRCEARCRRRGGAYSTTPNGHRQISEFRINANKALDQVMRIGSKMGMTPVERIKTTESAQGDLPLGGAVVKVETEDAGEDAQAITSIFEARPVRLVSDNSGD